MRLGAFVEDNALGEVLTPTAFTLAPKTVRIPDVAFISKGRQPKKTVKALPIAPDLAVEVISPSDMWSKIRDKVLEYQQAGMALVWVIDPEAETIFIYRVDTDIVPQAIGKKGTLDGENVMRGFTLPVAALFA